MKYATMLKRLALARDHTEQLTLLKRELGEKLETLSSPLAYDALVLLVI